jgi:outer membrane protein
MKKPRGANKLKLQNKFRIAEKCGNCQGAFQPTLQGFYSLVQELRTYSDRVVGVALISKSIMLLIIKSKCFTQISIGFGNPAPFFDQFSNNKGQSFGVQ